jgi:hypothetical protein
MTMALTLLLLSGASLARDVKCDRWVNGHKQRCEFTDDVPQPAVPPAQTAPPTREITGRSPPAPKPNRAGDVGLFIRYDSHEVYSISG